ncbi:MAG: hypothetical protein ACREF9_01850 [Opitutaceae bacterium]
MPDAAVAHAAGEGGPGAMSAEARAVAYVTRDVEVLVGGRTVSGRPHTEIRTITGANRDLAEALLLHGEPSVEARAARLGVEIQRRGDPPNAINIDRATFDEGFSSDLANATPEERAAHRRAADARARVVMLAAERYAGGETAPGGFAAGGTATDPMAPMSDTRVTAARDRLIGQLNERFGSDTLGAQLAAGLLTDARPSAETAALAMRHAMYSHAGTNEELIFRFTERMNRDEVADMRTAFGRQTGGSSLDAELGVYGEGGTFTELSGDDRLRMERAMLGQPRNDTERLEVAAFALQQQRRETGAFGAWLAEDTLAERVMSNTEQQLELLAGGPIALSRRGELMASLPNFDLQGRYSGPDRDTFLATASVAQQVAENYAKRIDAFADIATTGLAILGAIAAAAITVATGGAAGPLIAAAVLTGLASMAANYTIKGGRYGWEQAAVDLGMTAVQAVTAGVGAQLGAAAQVASKGAAAAAQASRTVVALSRIFTNNPVLNQIIVGAITGSISGLGAAALDERTWEHGGDDAVGELFAGLLKGGLTGAGTAAVTNAIESISIRGQAISQRLQALAAEGGLLRGGGAVLARGGARALIAGMGGMGGRTIDIAFESARGRFRGDAGDALTEIGKAGLHSAIQGFGEGVGEAGGQRFHNQRLNAAATEINETRRERGLPPLSGDAPTEGSPLRTAAEDLMFLNQHGRNGGDGLGRALNLDHVVTHGGMAPTIATVRPTPAIEDSMRAELMRHVPPEMHGDFADVPIRVLPEAEYHALTRSEAGPIVTLIQDGQPVVVVREGTPLSRLADEGPHLVQGRESHTRERVARLNEATLSNWDHLDLDTQLELYRTKIELEIDAHERIVRSLEREPTRNAGERTRVTAEIERANGTLRNLQARLDEVAGISPGQRAAIEAGEQNRPQYLEQPARLFSKDSPTGRGGSTSEDIAAVFAETLAELESRIRPDADEVADDPATPPLVPPEGHPEGDRDGRLFNRTRAEIDEMQARRERGNTFNTGQEGRYPHNEVRLVPEEGQRGQPRVDSVVVGEAIVERKHSQLAEIGEDAAIARVNEVLDDYPAGRRIADVPSNEAVLAESRARFPGADSDLLRGQPVLEIPEQHAPVPRAVLEHAERNGVIIRDPEGRIYSVDHPGGDAGVLRVSARDPDQHADAMREALQRHLPDDQRTGVADVPIVVLPEAQYRALTRSEAGPVATLVRDGEVVIVMREGTPVSRLADEGPHLAQAREAHTRERVARLDEATLSRWDSLDLDTQVELYRTKIELEIDAHERIVRSLDGEAARGEGDARRIAVERERAEGTLRNLRARREEVEGLGPQQRSAIASGEQSRPQYLEQPARLFSKDLPAGGRPGPPPPPKTVFEPFAGPSLGSAEELQRRYPGADVIASEASRPPTPDEIARFEQQGGRFVANRFGESLPGNSVDQMHVRFPLPHEKALEMAIDIAAELRANPGRNMVEIVQARQASVESLTNLAPHALRVLRPDGDMEIVFQESSITHEVEAATRLAWKDPASGETHRFEVVSPSAVVPRSIAPHSGFGIAADTHVNAVTLRKVRVAPGEPAAPSSADPAKTGRVITEAERVRGREERTARKLREREERGQRRDLREERAAAARSRAQEQAEAVGRRQANTEHEADERSRALLEGRLTEEEDLRQRLSAVATGLNIGIDDLVRTITLFKQALGGSGRRFDAQDVIDSLRNRVREGRPPRFGDLEGLVSDIVMEQNAIAVQQMREHIAGSRPDAVLGVERGGAFLAEVLARGAEDFPPSVPIAKHVEPRAGRPDLVQRIPNLESEIRRRITDERQSRFAIVDFYMGGVFAGELQRMFADILRDHPHAQFEVLWMRETFGFEKAVVRPTRQDLEEGIAFTGIVEIVNGRMTILEASPGVTLPPLKGTGQNIPQVRATHFPVDVVLGDDMRAVLDQSPTVPIRIFDRDGRIVQEIPVGTPDPETGEPLRTTKEIMIRLMQGARFEP